MARLTTNEVAIKLNMAPRTVRGLLQEGKLPGFKVGRKWQIDERELIKFGVLPQDDVTSDQYVDQHREELIYFGVCLRDRLEIEPPHKIIDPEVSPAFVAKQKGFAMWTGTQSYIDQGADIGAVGIDNDWGFERVDGRTHPQYPMFQQHLAKNSCWPALENVETQYRRYVLACARVRLTLSGHVHAKLPSLERSAVNGLATALLRDSYENAKGRHHDPSSLSEVDSHVEDGEVWWYVRLGHIAVGREREASALLPIMEAYPGLLESASAMTIHAVVETSEMAQKALQEFTGHLSPNAKLRKLVVDGLCEVCS